MPGRPLDADDIPDLVLADDGPSLFVAPGQGAGKFQRADSNILPAAYELDEPRLHAARSLADTPISASSAHNAGQGDSPPGARTAL